MAPALPLGPRLRAILVCLAVALALALLAPAEHLLIRLAGRDGALCLLPLALVLALAVPIGWELYRSVQEVKAALCDAVLRRDGLAKRLCRARLTTAVLAAIAALVFAAKLVMALHIAGLTYRAMLLADAVIYPALYLALAPRAAAELTPATAPGGARFAATLANLAAVFALFAAAYFALPNPGWGPLDLAAPGRIDAILLAVDSVCVEFRHVLRTLALIEDILLALRNLEGASPAVGMLAYFLWMSLVPFLALTLLFRFALDRLAR